MLMGIPVAFALANVAGVTALFAVIARAVTRQLRAGNATVLGFDPANVVYGTGAVMLISTFVPLFYSIYRMNRLRAETADRAMLPCLTCGHTVTLDQQRCPECGMDARGTIEGWTRWRRWMRFAPPRG